MWNSLYGTITHAGINHIHFLVGGMEWEIAVPTPQIHRLNEDGGKCRVFTHLVHREDQMKLYGFSSPKEREVFIRITRVSGIGPSQGMKILSAVNSTAFIQHIENGDVNALSKIPGLGKKTAQKLILALAGKLADTSGTDEGSGELEEALVGMGFDRKKVREILKKIMKDTPGEDSLNEPEILKKAIMELST